MTEFITSVLGDTVAVDLRGDGPTVVFVPGAGPFRAIDPTTTATAEYLSERRIRTAVYDRPGRGESPATGRIGLDRELAALAAVIDAVGAPAVLCGHSSGCAISLKAAAEGLPVAGLLLWEAPLDADPDDTADWADRFESLLDDDDLPSATDWYMRDMPAEWLVELKASPIWPGIVSGVPSQRADAQALTWAAAALAEGSLSSITVPVLATHGTTTFPEMPAAARRLRVALPDARTAEIAGADHEWDAETMAAALSTFVRGLP